MKVYLVVGVYEHDLGRFATSVSAKDPDDAEARARKEAAGELIVAAVIEGTDLKVVA
jgi:hypothetical protein